MSATELAVCCNAFSQLRAFSAGLDGADGNCTASSCSELSGTTALQSFEWCSQGGGATYLFKRHPHNIATAPNQSTQALDPGEGV